MPDPSSSEFDHNPYHPYEENDRHRAFREGWRARQAEKPRSANPYPFAQAGRALAWLDGWTAAIGEEERTAIDWRQREEARRVATSDSTRNRSDPSTETVDA